MAPAPPRSRPSPRRSRRVTPPACVSPAPRSPFTASPARAHGRPWLGHRHLDPGRRLPLFTLERHDYSRWRVRRRQRRGTGPATGCSGPVGDRGHGGAPVLERARRRRRPDHRLQPLPRDGRGHETLYKTLGNVTSYDDTTVDRRHDLLLPRRGREQRRRGHAVERGVGNAGERSTAPAAVPADRHPRQLRAARRSARDELAIARPG